MTDEELNRVAQAIYDFEFATPEAVAELRRRHRQSPPLKAAIRRPWAEIRDEALEQLWEDTRRQYPEYNDGGSDTDAALWQIVDDLMRYQGFDPEASAPPPTWPKTLAALGIDATPEDMTDATWERVVEELEEMVLAGLT